jgi:hypothetical protein
LGDDTLAGEKVRIEQGKANQFGTRPKRMVHIVPDFWRLIEFMFYSFTRPHDIRLLQHKQFEIKQNEHTYLIARSGFHCAEKQGIAANCQERPKPAS